MRIASRLPAAIVVLASIATLLLMPGLAAAAGSGGDLDQAFGSTGGLIRATEPLVGFGHSTVGVVVQPDGKSVSAWVSDPATAGSEVLHVQRRDDSGALDATFGVAGEAQFNVVDITDLNGGFATDCGAKMGPSNTIVLCLETSLQQALIVRVTSGGALDSTFGGDGSAVVASPQLLELNGMTVRPNGDVVIAGWGLGTHVEAVVAQLTTSGVVDTSFGGTGYVVYDNTFGVKAMDVVADGNDVVVTGTATGAASSHYMMLWKLDDFGTPVAAFNGGGPLLLQSGAPGVGESAKTLLVSGSDGYIVGTSGAASVATLVKLNLTTGALDTSYGTNGIATPAIGAPWRAALDPAGRLLIVQRASGNVYRVATDGTADPAFDGDGRATIAYGDDRFPHVAVQLDGSAIVFGRTTTPDAIHDETATIARLTGNDAVAPIGSVNSIDETTQPAFQFHSGASIWVNPAHPGSFTVHVTASDDHSGVSSMTFPALGTGFTMGASTATSQVYSWDGTAVDPGSKDIVITDNAGNTATVALTVHVDSTGPGGTITYPVGASNDASPLVHMALTDTGGAGVASYTVERASETLAFDLIDPCTGNINYSLIDSSGSDFHDALIIPQCFVYRAAAVDNVGNSSYVTGTGEMQFDNAAPTASVAISAGTHPEFQHQNGGTYYVNTLHTGSFTATVTAADTHTGIDSISFPSLGTGWTDAVTSSTEHTYDWTGTSSGGTQQIAVLDTAGNAPVAAPQLTIATDVAAPHGALLHYTSGATSNPIVSVDVITAGAADDGAGISGYSLQRAEAPAVAGVCGSFGGFAQVSSATGTVFDTLPGARCYRYQLLVSDFVGNVDTIAGAGDVVYAPATAPTPRTPVGSAAGETLTGTTLSEVIHALGGNDTVHGGAGNDRLYGDAGNDKLYGDAGNDLLSDTTGKDTFDGGIGNDKINARDAKGKASNKDKIKCGGGKDTVTANKNDVVAKDCEKVVRKA